MKFPISNFQFPIESQAPSTKFQTNPNIQIQSEKLAAFPPEEVLEIRPEELHRPYDI